MTKYFRQLSFIDPRLSIPNRTNRAGDGSFVRKYLDQPEAAAPCPEILSGRDPQDMPEVQVQFQKSTTYASTGPDQGITTIHRSKLHLSATSDIDFIDNNNLESDFEVRRSKRANAQRFGGIVGSVAESRLTTSNSSNKIHHRKGLSEVHQAPETNTIASAPLHLKDGSDSVAGIPDWTADSDYSCGISTSLYERNPVSLEVTGSPIADCYALIAREDSCILALADGVNWGEKASLAARAALRGSVEYLETALFGTNAPIEGHVTTRDVFVSLLRSLWEGHNCILEVGGALTTLTIAVVVPKISTTDNEPRKWIVCACNVGDSLGFVYSPQSGVREFTMASHDTTMARDMRDALGALGPVDGNRPELSNLTLSMTEVDDNDIVFLTSDGVSDNFDPVVGRFAVAAPIHEPDLGDIKTRLKVNNARPQQAATTNKSGTNHFRPKLQQQVSLQPTTSVGLQTTTPVSGTPTKRPQYSRSRTVIEPRRTTTTVGLGAGRIPRSPSSNLPQVTAEQRHKLTLLRLEDLLSYGINGQHQPCDSARKLCQLLIDFSTSITAARRKLLEQKETYVRLVTDSTGQRRESELNRIQQRAARKRVVDSTTFQALPGKLDHASVVAFMCRSTKETVETESGLGRANEVAGPRRAVIETDL